MTRLRRTDDFDSLNELLNHPDIYPWVRGDFEGPLDAKVVTKPSIILEADHGAFWFIDEGEGVWEAHTLFPPGSDAYECALEAIEYISSMPGYTKIVTQGPRNNPRAVRFLEKLGFHFTHTEGMYQGYPLDYYEYS